MQSLQKKEPGVNIIIMNISNNKYIIVFLITAGIFIVVFGLVFSMNARKIAHLDSLQQKISIDLMATETQFDLLKTAPCSSLGTTSLSRELGQLGEKLDFTQRQQSSNNEELIQLKKYYSLLQVKDYLLTQEIADKCDLHIDSVLYFYTNDCSDCVKQGYILTEFKKDYPEIRIYSFDLDLDFSVIDTFSGLYQLEEEYPVIIVNNIPYSGFQDRLSLNLIFSDYIAKTEQDRLIKEGKIFIQGLDEYESIEISDISFLSNEENRYEYTLQTDDSVENIILVYSKDTLVFEKEE